MKELKFKLLISFVIPSAIILMGFFLGRHSVSPVKQDCERRFKSSESRAVQGCEFAANSLHHQLFFCERKLKVWKSELEDCQFSLNKDN